MTIFFQKLFECAARGCPSFLVRVKSLKSAVALKKKNVQRVVNYTPIPVQMGSELFMHVHQKL
jgi:hypothetical protein